MLAKWFCVNDFVTRSVAPSSSHSPTAGATGGKDALHRARVAAHLLADASVASIVVDCETGLVRLGLAAELARELRGGYVRLAELSAQQVAGVVRAAA